MKTLEFQLESKPFFTAAKQNRFPVAYILSPEFTTAGIESLLIGQCFRGWLTDSEKNFLDLLVHDHSLLFLLKEGRFLHPEDVVLFPMELIETACREGGEAFFSHRLEALTSSGKGYYKVHTAQIAMPDGIELMLGMLCPEFVGAEFEPMNKFSELVLSFRQAAQKIDNILGAIKKDYETDVPTLIINRSSGRLLNLNPAAVKLFGQEERLLIDLEYSQFRKQLARVMADYKIKMENFNRSENSLTIMTLSDEKAVNQSDEPYLADYFLDSIHNKIAGTVTAASYLETLTDIGRDTEETELIEIILSEINNLDMLMSHFRLLVNFEHLPNNKINLLTELDRAVDNIKNDLGIKCPVHIDELPMPVYCEVPQTAYLYLFESILRTHFESFKEIRSTHIHITMPDNGGNLGVVFETEGSQFKTSSFCIELWQKYSRLLTKNLHLEWSDSVDDQKAVTQITNFKLASE